jgi:hypothetical protein
MSDAIDDGLLARSPCHRIELPAAVLPVIEPLTPAQILTLADSIDPRYRAMVLLAAGCGLRWPEAAGLTRDRIHLGARAHVIIDRQLAYRPRHHPPQPRGQFAAAVRPAEDRGGPPGHPDARHRDRGWAGSNPSGKTPSSRTIAGAASR